ncbi:MAG TPA: hypothetical protein VMC06_05800 [Opitutaceae bacterium]|nr:hypothetical protein [Opitutaceae bacterium]
MHPPLESSVNDRTGQHPQSICALLEDTTAGGSRFLAGARNFT